MRLKNLGLYYYHYALVENLLLSILLLGLTLLRLRSKKNNKILIIVPTTSLVEQLTKDFKDYGYNSEKNVHKIYQGMKKIQIKEL